MRSLCIAAAIVAACLSAGCGGADGPSVVPVSGVITVDGAPAAHVHIKFRPYGKNVEAPRSEGYADAEGRYTVRTTTGTGRKGAFVGEHDVSISGVEDMANRDEWKEMVATGENEGDPPIVTPPSMTPPTVAVPQDKIPIRFTVPPGGTDEANFDL